MNHVSFLLNIYKSLYIQYFYLQMFRILSCVLIYCSIYQIFYPKIDWSRLKNFFRKFSDGWLRSQSRKEPNQGRATPGLAQSYRHTLSFSQGCPECCAVNGYTEQHPSHWLFSWICFFQFNFSYTENLLTIFFFKKASIISIQTLQRHHYTVFSFEKYSVY